MQLSLSSGVPCLRRSVSRRQVVSLTVSAYEVECASTFRSLRLSRVSLLCILDEHVEVAEALDLHRLVHFGECRLRDFRGARAAVLHDLVDARGMAR